MDKKSFIIEHLVGLWQVSATIYNRELEPILGQFASGRQLPMGLLKQLKTYCLQEKIPQMVMLDDNIYYWGLYLEDESLLCLGPMSHMPLSEAQVRAFKHHQHIKEPIYLVPAMSVFASTQVVAGLVAMVYQLYLTSDQIMQANSHISQVQEGDLIRYQYEVFRSEQSHHPYEHELSWLQALSEGHALSKDFFQSDKKDFMEGIGIMSAKGGTKQMEYLVVSMITLATRVAINVGLSPYKMYDLSDLYLQRLSISHTAMDMLSICYKAIDRFSEEIRAYRKQQGLNPYVKQCKDYIEKHIFEALSVEKIAKALGLHRSYLSKLFKEQENRVLSHYLREQKLKAAKDLLIYSQESIGAIAESLQFTSSSHFSAQFKSLYGQTPLHYRRQYQMKDD